MVTGEPDSATGSNSSRMLLLLVSAGRSKLIEVLDEGENLVSKC